MIKYPNFEKEPTLTIVYGKAGLHSTPYVPPISITVGTRELRD